MKALYLDGINGGRGINKKSTLFPRVTRLMRLLTSVHPMPLEYQTSLNVPTNLGKRPALQTGGNFNTANPPLFARNHA